MKKKTNLKLCFVCLFLLIGKISWASNIEFNALNTKSYNFIQKQDSVLEKRYIEIEKLFEEERYEESLKKSS